MFTINANQLKAIVKQLAKLQPKHAPVSYLEADENGVWVVSSPQPYGGRASFRLTDEKYPPTIAAGFNAKVLSQQLTKLVPGSRKAGRVAVVVSEDELLFTFDGYTATVKTSQAENWDIEHAVGSGPIVLRTTGKDLVDAWLRVKPALGSDDTLPMLTHAALVFDGDKVELVATDRFRLHMATVAGVGFRPEQGRFGSSGVPVPRHAFEAVEALYKGLNNDVNVRFNSETGAGEVYTKAMRFTFTAEFDYPRVKGLIPPTPTPHTVSFDRKQLATALKKFKGFTKNQVRFERTSDGVMLSASDGENVRLEKVLEASTTLDEPVRFNPAYLLDAVDLFDKKDLTMHITEANRPTVMHDERLLTLVMPARMPA